MTYTENNISLISINNIILMLTHLYNIVICIYDIFSCTCHSGSFPIILDYQYLKKARVLYCYLIKVLHIIKYYNLAKTENILFYYFTSLEF